jgi:hypothetical protein
MADAEAKAKAEKITAAKKRVSSAARHLHVPFAKHSFPEPPANINRTAGGGLEEEEGGESS